MLKPDIEGDGVRAWKIPKPDWRDRPEWQAGIAQWLVYCTWGHPAWQNWVVGVVHLRPIEGVEQARKHYPEAEYEFLIATLDPEKPIDLDGEMKEGWHFLKPLDVVFHFHGVSDAQAAAIAELAVRAIAEGRISPDRDFRRAWRQMLEATIEHYRTRVH